MSRDLPSSVDNAIDNEVSYRFLMKATVEPSFIYIDAIDNDNPTSGSDLVGIVDNPNMQDIQINPNSGSLVTWWTDTSDALKYVRQGSSTEVTIDLVATFKGKPGPYGNFLYFVRGSAVYRRGVNWNLIDVDDDAPFSSFANLGSHSGTPVACHGVSDTRCVVIHYDDGGLRVQVWDDTTSYNQPGRFMFPKAVDYTDLTTSGSERSALSLATFSGAVEYDGKIFVYLSNPQTGAVEGISWDISSKVWSDVFVAVATDIKSSLCEFRVCNAFAHNGTAYLVGQFQRTENVGTDYVYTMVLSSQDGRTYSLDGFTLVSQLGYRFLAKVGEGRLFIGNCNRVSSGLLTYVFDGTSGSGGLIMDIPMEDFITFREANVAQNELRLKAGDDFYAYHSYMQEGSRIKLYLGYDTSSGEEYVLYATYIVDSIANTTAQGRRTYNLNLVQFSEWKLSGLSSPFYHEFFAKSSVYDDCGEESGNLYVAPNTHDYRETLVVDFWGHIPYDDADATPPIDGDQIIWQGGVTHLDDSGAHRHGIRTRDLTEILDIADYPEVTGNAQIKVYGWSHANSGTANDVIDLILFVKKADGTEETYITDEGQQWPNYYPTYAAHDGQPLTFNISSGSLAAGDKVMAIGLSIEGNDTDVCPARAEFTSGFKIKYNYDDGNTPWTRDVGTLKLPGPLRPYIMFSQKPYDAWNSFQVAEFTNSTTGGVAGYPTGAGLVCLAMDGGSYILGRYDKNGNNWEIVKVRDGTETILTSGSPSSSVAETYTMGFSHRDGKFGIWWEKAGKLVEELSYTWQASDGWMYESTTISRKCGIWGQIDAPWFETAGLNFSNKPDTPVTSDGIPYLPGFDVADFPSSGQVKIGEAVFSYTSKVESDPVLGPHQLRQHGKYDPPYGNGSYGLENLYFEWNRSDSSDIGKLVALDNGTNYVISSSEYQVWNSTGGVRANLHHRSRQYSANEMIAKSTKFIANRVYVTGGLKGIDLVEGETSRFRMHEKVSYKVEGDININWYRASSGRAELTVRDLIQQVSGFSGASAEFPGDTVISSGSLAADTFYNVGEQPFADGIDLSFQIDDLATNDWIEVTIDATIGSGSSGDNQASVKIIKTGATTFTIDFISYPSWTVIESLAVSIQDPDELPFRVVFHDDFVTLDIGRGWVHTFGTDGITYNTDCDVYLRSNVDTDFVDVLLTELSDWREAIYIDLETDGRAALSSVIQERPIETSRESNGSIAYWYDRTRDRVTQVVEPRRHNRKRQHPRGCASDAIVYYSDVAAIQNTAYAARYGFSTKVYRFPNLTVGAVRAAEILMQRLLEAAIQHRLQIRPDLRLEVGDVLDVDFTASGTQKNIAMGVIVEGINMTYAAGDGNSYMEVSGREEL
ncbi:MAG: hypothetical protein ACXABD_09645 [Candidatus Thorarchaeota archaeon]